MKGGYRVKLSKRQEQIAQIVREEGPVTGSAIAEHLEVTRSALRSDLSVLTMLGFRCASECRLLLCGTFKRNTNSRAIKVISGK